MPTAKARRKALRRRFRAVWRRISSLISAPVGIRLASFLGAIGLVVAVTMWLPYSLWPRVILGLTLAPILMILVLLGAARFVAAVDATGLFAAAVLSPTGPWWRGAFAIGGFLFVFMMRQFGAIVWPDVAVLFVAGFAGYALLHAGDHKKSSKSTQPTKPITVCHLKTVTCKGPINLTIINNATATTTVTRETTTTVASTTTTTTVSGPTTTTTLSGSTVTRTKAGSTTTVTTTKSRLVIKRFRFRPDPAGGSGSQATFWIEDTHGNRVREALVYVLSLEYAGFRTWQASGSGGKVSVLIPVRRSTLAKHGGHVVVFVRAKRLTDGATARRLFRFRVRR
jgi:hypothetical protein